MSHPEFNQLDAAFCCGYAAACDGYALANSNPYPLESPEGCEYLRGFRVGHREMEGKQRSYSLTDLHKVAAKVYQELRKDRRLLNEDDANKLEVLVDVLAGMLRPDPEPEEFTIELEELEVEL